MTLSVELTPPPFDPELGAALPAIAQDVDDDDRHHESAHDST